MPTPILTQSQGFKSPMMSVPEQPNYLELQLTFNAGNPDASLTKDFAQELANLRIDFIQCIYIDNSADANALTLSFNDGIFSITVKGHTQGWYPVAVPEGIVRMTATNGAAATVNKNIILSSVMVPPCNWATV
jgi:hypothetical protein